MILRYRVFSAGRANAEFAEYGDAQRASWERLRSDGAGYMVAIKSLCADGNWREMETWTVGPSGRFACSTTAREAYGPIPA